jgi:small subunit ribosomal protein S4
MGDPKKQRKKYSRPLTPWETGRIEEEKSLKREFGLKNKKEIWKIRSLLRRYLSEAKRLITDKSRQSEFESEKLLSTLRSYGLIEASAKLDDVLEINSHNILSRRLQNVVFKKGLSRTVKQARQMIVHGHIVIGDKKITIPSYLTKVEEEELISYQVSSAFSSIDHPERKKTEEIKNDG